MGDFAEERAALEAAFSRYDTIRASRNVDGAALAVAEHQIMLASKALTRQSTPPGVFALDLVFQVRQ